MGDEKDMDIDIERTLDGKVTHAYNRELVQRGFAARRNGQVSHYRVGRSITN